MEHQFHLSQSRGTYRRRGGDRPATSEKVPQHPMSDADKVVDTPTAAGVPTISTPHNDMDKEVAHRPSSTDGEIWPKGPPDTD